MNNVTSQSNLPYKPQFDDGISGKIDPLLRDAPTRLPGIPQRRVEALARLNSGETLKRRKLSGAAKVAIAGTLTVGGAAITDGFEGLPVAEQITDVVQATPGAAKAVVGNMTDIGGSVDGHFDSVNLPPGGQPLEYRGGVAYEPGTDNTIVVPDIQDQP